MDKVKKNTTGKKAEDTKRGRPSTSTVGKVKSASKSKSSAVKKTK